LDAIVFDIQDIGTRFYTYISTLQNVMEEAAKAGKPVFVLDRPNPINGIDVAGAIADADKLTFVATHTLPVRHGMTTGELAQMFNVEKKINADLRVIKMENWQRADVVRPDESDVDESFAEYAFFDRSDALSGNRTSRIHESFSRARHRHAV
jgi:uncharacterized protein YbbC (DUF1343 family)